MVLDIHSMAAAAREHYYVIGERHATASVLAQADKSIRGLELHAAALIPYGFGLGDGQRLVEGRAKLYVKATGKSQAKGTRKLTTRSRGSARRFSRQERRSVRTVLGTARNLLLESGDEQNAEMVTIALDQTSKIRNDASLPLQLETLLAVLEHPVVVPLVAERGGPDIAQRIQSTLGTLTGVSADYAAESPVTIAAEEQNILGGVVVTLVRSANAAAQVAAKRLGMPSIAAAFALTHLERSRRSAASEEPEAPGESETPAEPEAGRPGTLTDE
jgi:hypothetical protein